MKKVLSVGIILMFVLVGCSDDDEDVIEDTTVDIEQEANEDEEETETETETEEEIETIHRETNLDLDDFIETYNNLLADSDTPHLERKGNEMISAGGLAVSVNEDGTISSIVQPIVKSSLIPLMTMFAVKEQVNDVDAKKIDDYLDSLTESMDNNEPFVDELEIDNMIIKVNAAGSSILSIVIFGEEI